jgi:hypothetical protein
MNSVFDQQGGDPVATSEVFSNRVRWFRALCWMVITLPAGPFLRAAPPSEEAQYFLELINRARSNPEAEVTRLSGSTWAGTPDLNEGLAPGTVSPDAKPPIAFDPRLNDASLMNNLRISPFYRDWGNRPYRMLPEGFEINPSSIGETTVLRCLGENFPIGFARRIEDHSDAVSITSDRVAGSLRFKKDVEAMHEIFFIDSATDGRQRRRRILDSDWVLMGLDFAPNTGRRYPNDGVSAFPFITTHTFVDASALFSVTGVVYHDWNGNGFYDMGEAPGSLDVWIENGTGRVLARSRTYPSGGYTIPFAGRTPGSYRLFVKDSDGVVDSKNFNWTGNQNVKVDIVDPPFTADFVEDSLQDVDIAGGFTPKDLRGWGVKPSVSLLREVRDRRPFVVHGALVNRGFSKVLVQVNVSTMRGQRFQFRYTAAATARGLSESQGMRFGLLKSYVLQTDETILLSARILPRRHPKDARIRRIKPGLSLQLAVRIGPYFGDWTDTVVFNLKDRIPKPD